MSYISPQGEASTTAEIALLSALNTLAITPSGKAIIKTGIASFANATFDTSVASADGSITVTNPTTTVDLAVVSAPKLTTPRTINTVSFDGTANITVTAAAGTLTGATLAANVLASSLTSVGTLLNLTVTNTITGSISGNAATVTTNANLTGVITSVGNATSIASQTGTGTKFVVDTSPTIITPTFTTSATVPLIVGGSGTTQTLTLKTTSGVGAAGADIIFQTGNNGATEAMRILNNGNVGIGTASPGARLDVQSSTGADTVRVGGSQNPQLSLMTSGGSTMRNWGITSNTNIAGDFNIVQSANNSSVPATSRLTIVDGGSVGIGTTSPWRTLAVTGTVGFDGLTGATGAGSLCLDSNKQVVYNSASDACLSSTRATKKDIADLTLTGLDVINALQSVSFVYKQGDGRTRYGFIAEDVAAINDVLATHNEAGTITGIDDRAILSVVVKAIKELDAKVVALAAQVKDIAVWFAGGKFRVQSDVCVDDVCVTKAQFKQMLQNAGASQSSGSASTSSSGGGSTTTSTTATTTSSSDTATTTDIGTSTTTATTSAADTATGTSTTATTTDATSAPETGTSTTTETSPDATSTQSTTVDSSQDTTP